MMNKENQKPFEKENELNQQNLSHNNSKRAKDRPQETIGLLAGKMAEKISRKKRREGNNLT